MFCDLMKTLLGCMSTSALLLSLVTAPCALAQAVSASTGAFRQLAAVDTLQRGKTDKAAVTQLLGIPNGSGAALSNALGGGERQIWYYEDVQMTGAQPRGGTLFIDMRQQILLVFFKGEVVDGYLWTSNAGTMQAGR